MQVGADEALFTIAEMSIGVAGFSAIVAAFTGQGPLTTRDRRRFVWLFTSSFIAALLSFIPVLLQEAVAAADLWRASSAVMCVIWAISSGAWTVAEVRHQSAEPEEEKGLWQRPYALVPSFLNFVVQLANASGFLWEPSAAVYVAGTLVWLYVAALTFISIVLERGSAPSS